LKRGADPNRGSPYESPLHLAADNGNVSIMQLLLDHGARIDELDTNGETPLFVAISSGHEQAALELIARGADWRIVNPWKVTPAQVAALSDAPNVVNYMLNHGLDPETPAGDFERPLLFWAAAGGAGRTVQLILDAGGKVADRDRFGYEPLMAAAAAPHSKSCIDALVAAGADPNARQVKSGWTSLHFAAIAGEADAIGDLCLAGADPNARDEEGRTPLHLAAVGGKPANAAQLLSLGSDPNAQDAQGETPLHFATLENDPAMVRILGDAKLNPELVDKQGRTPFDIARAMGDPDLNTAYQAIGFNLEKSDPTQRTTIVDQIRQQARKNDRSENVREGGNYGPLPLFARKGDVDSMRRLLDSGTNPNEARDASGWTALHFAAAAGNEIAVKLLLDHGADANRKDGEGRTPLHIAAITRHRAIYDLLRTKGHADLTIDREGHDPQAYWDIDPLAEPEPLYYGFFPAVGLKADLRNP
jgi:cytohesin